MTEAVFAGAQVGPKGVSPDSSKLTAIVDWPIPEDASHLEGFLGLTSYFISKSQIYFSMFGATSRYLVLLYDI
jgi:hypothetical protein